MLEEALKQDGENAVVEFKASFDVARSGDWLEIIKDIVAMANSGGGVILIGLNDDGSASGKDITGALALDAADLTNRIYKYTNYQFHGFEVCECRKADVNLCAIKVGAAKLPMVFTKVGTYEYEPSKQKTAFSQGTVYFRHGAKSEPCTSDDLRAFVEREVEAIRHSWLDGIAKVVEAPSGSRFAVLPPENHPVGPSGALPMRLTDDPDAPPYYAVPLDSTHPYRQKEVVKEVNKRLTGKRTINSHDILSIRRVHQVQKDISMCFTQNYASPRYSQAFVDWIVREFDADTQFFDKAKVDYERLRSANGS